MKRSIAPEYSQCSLSLFATTLIQGLLVMAFTVGASYGSIPGVSPCVLLGTF
jgi:hypothetical protein